LRKTDLYYESHITISPEFDEKLEELKGIVKLFNFRVADLLFAKRACDTPERSRFDTFCTARNKSYDEIRVNTLGCVEALGRKGFKVWRYKIEDTLLDVRCKE
jgi:hypothetical protein